MYRTIIIVASLSLLAGLVLGQNPALSRDPDTKIDPGSHSCREYIELVDAEDGRADVRTVWAHGYKSALEGFDKDSPPVSVLDVVEFAKALEEACRENPEDLWITTVKNLN